MRENLEEVCVMTSECLRVGGQKIHGIDDKAKSTVSQLISTAMNTSNSVVISANNANKDLVFYATQIVAGISHRIIYKIYDIESPYVCFKLWAKPSGEIQVSVAAYADSIEDAGIKCNFAVV